MGRDKLSDVVRLPYIDDAMVEQIIDAYSKGHNVGRKIYNVPNTKGMKSESIRKLPKDALIRVAGGYPDDYVRKYADGNEDWMFDCVVYYKDELADILEIMENIENGIDKKWSDKKRAVYLYNSILNRLDKFGWNKREYLADEIASLRGFLNKSTVCAGCSLMYKELCDRNDIECDMVLGCCKGGEYHVWNRLTIEGKQYPVDLYWDVGAKLLGRHGEVWEHMAHDISEFHAEHLPDKVFKRRSGRLGRISTAEMKMLRKSVGTFRIYDDADVLVDEHGNSTVFGQIGFDKIGSREMYKYIVLHKKDGVLGDPQVCVTDHSIKYCLDAAWSDRGDAEYKDMAGVIYNALGDLFSQDNFNRAREYNTSYVGKIGVASGEKGRELEWATISFTPNSYMTKKYKAEGNLRLLSAPDDPSNILCVQQVGQALKNGMVMNKYNCYAIVRNGENGCRKKVITDSFESLMRLEEITLEEVLRKIDFDHILALAYDKEPDMEK